MRTRLILLALFCAGLLFPSRAFAAVPAIPAYQQADIIPGELIVIMKPGNSVGALSLPEKTHIPVKKHPGLEKLNAGVINVPVGEESAYISKLKRQKGVLVVEPNYRVSAVLSPNDPAYPTDQYGPALIQAETAWDTTTGSNSVTIAIIDSGLDTSHPEFTGRTTAGYDFVESDSVPQDECGHGTHVAGIAAATGNNAQGIAGVAWNVRIMPLRVLNSYCGGSFANVASALIWAADHGAQVVNLSLGASSPSVLMENAVYYAYNRGVAIFAASGNYGTSPTLYPVLYPAAYPQVMAVGSLDNTMTRAPSSNYGTALDLMAPGVNIYSTLPMNSGFYYNSVFGTSTQYDYLSGTSMASPHAAGAAALLMSMPGVCFETPDQVYQALMDSALDLGAGGWDQYYGHGLIQIADAMLECPASPPPLVPFTIEYDLVTSLHCTPLVQYNWRDATGGTWHVSVGDSGSVPVSLPFTFNFGGQDYTSIRAHANGFISLGNNNTDLTDGNFRTNFSLPTGARPDNFIAPFWDDLTDNSGIGRLYTATLGTAPNREFVIEYQEFQRVGVTGSLHFEAILYESSNLIKLQYRPLTGSGSDGSSATVGLEYGNTSVGFAGYEFSYNQPGALEDGLALLFIPYTGGAPTLPSHAVCPRTEAVTIESGIASACNAFPAAFDVDIAAGEMPYRSVLKVQQLTTVPSPPSSFLDLQHYADISLAYSPPFTTMSMPEVDVCYQYTPQDLLAAGGHPENLFIAAHDKYSNQWQRLTTTVDTLNSRLFAHAPHFSYYSVGTISPSAGTSAGSARGQMEGLGLPTTGVMFSHDLLVFLAVAGGVVFISSGIWLRRKRRR